MSDSSSKRSAVFRFMFLPQWGDMLKSSSFVIPLFMTTIANLFAQAGLIPPAHPALRYGLPGVEKCSLKRLMGDAWYTLRTSRATPYQWSIFSSVMVMMFVMVTSVFLTCINLLFTFIGSASAQIFIFSNPLGDSSDATAAIPGPCDATNWSFCRVIPPPGGAHGDYAIDILDKMLRLGANNKGAPVQNGLQALMEIYNSAVMVVAGIMIFWLIISIVVDVAKTGHVGGGRHNLVWAPIRVVFALVLLIPLGNTGFSSGQFGIMKVAEWGSNLGSNAWNAYLAVVLKGAQYIPDDPLGSEYLPLVQNYTKMWVCRVAHNGYGYQSQGQYTPGDPATNTPASGFDLDTQAVKFVHNASMADNGRINFAYSNKTAGALCGTVSVPTGNSPEMLAAADPANTSLSPVAKATLLYQRDMEQAWMSLFVKGAGAAFSEDGLGPDLKRKANAWACGFVGQHIWGSFDGVFSGNFDINQLNPLWINCGGAIGAAGGEVGPDPSDTAQTCGAGKPGDGVYPDMRCVDSSNDDEDTGTMAGIITKTINDAAVAAKAHYQGLTATEIFGTRGWADMASFYKSIATMTTTVHASKAIPVQIQVGSAQGDGDNQGQKVMEVMEKFDDWWDTVPKGLAPPAAPKRKHSCSFFCHVGHAFGAVKSAVVGTVEKVGGFIDGVAHFIGGVFSTMVDGFGKFQEAIKTVIDAEQGNSILGIPNADCTDLPPWMNAANCQKSFPLQVISGMGSTLITMAIAIFVAVTTVEAALGVIPTLSIGSAIASSALGWLVDGLSGILLSCGFVLVFWLPLLPFIRVAHAVLTWMVVVFEAVMLVPIAALSFLSTVGEGWNATHVFVQWLEVLFRPVLTVIGFVGAILVFNTFFSYFQDAFLQEVKSQIKDANMFEKFFYMIANTVIFTFVMYTAANTCFKLLSVLPSAFYRWAPLSGRPSGFDELGPNGEEVMMKMGSIAHQGMNGARGAVLAGAKGVGTLGGLLPGGGGGAPSVSSAGSSGSSGAAGAEAAGGSAAAGSGAAAGGSAAAAGGAAEVASVAAVASDRRLKENIELVGTQNGFNLYKFSYIGDPQRYIGVMAQEVLKIMPEAVTERNGYLAVYYDKIRVPFHKVH